MHDCARASRNFSFKLRSKTTLDAFLNGSPIAFSGSDWLSISQDPCSTGPVRLPAVKIHLGNPRVRGVQKRSGPIQSKEARPPRIPAMVKRNTGGVSELNQSQYTWKIRQCIRHSRPA